MSEYQKYIYEKYKTYTWDKPVLENLCSEVQGNFNLNNTQRFISDFVKPSNLNGILLWHSVGSGKTLSAIAILKNFEKQGYNTLWITRKTLKKDIEKGLNLLPLSKPLTIASYKQFSNIFTIKTKLYESLMSKAKTLNPNTSDPLYKTVIIIDEVHKLFTNDLLPQEAHDINVIQDMIHNSYRQNNIKNRCKVILLSATPITKDPIEIIQLLNLIIVNDYERFNINTFKTEYLTESGKFTDKSVKIFKEKIRDLVSYIDMSQDPSKFAQTSYKEVLVPTSVPSFVDLLINGNIQCNQNHIYCTTIGVPKKECDKLKQKCLEEVKYYKKKAKDNSYQSVILEDKCGLNIGM